MFNGSVAHTFDKTNHRINLSLFHICLWEPALYMNNPWVSYQLCIYFLPPRYFLDYLLHFIKGTRFEEDNNMQIRTLEILWNTSKGLKCMVHVIQLGTWKLLNVVSSTLSTKCYVTSLWKVFIYCAIDND